jgi:transposase
VISRPATDRSRRRVPHPLRHSADRTLPCIPPDELEIVRKNPDQRSFQVQSKRWAVERTFSWLTSHQRLARDYEASPARSETMIRWAMIGIMVRRLTRGRPSMWPGPKPLVQVRPDEGTVRA